MCVLWILVDQCSIVCVVVILPAQLVFPEINLVDILVYAVSLDAVISIHECHTVIFC